MYSGQVLYKQTKTGAIQVWFQEMTGDKYRTVSGQRDGKRTVSGWNTCTSKNIGKVNEVDADLQCAIEVEANYIKQLRTGYVRNVDDVRQGKKYFEPMLAHKYQSFPGPGYVQPKLDGVRCIVRHDGMWSRNGTKIVGAPHIFDAVKSIFEGSGTTDFVIDGELYNHDFKEDFNSIISMVRKTKPTDDDLTESKKYIQYHVYDTFCFDSPTQSFASRLDALECWFGGGTPDNFYPMIQPVDTQYVNSCENSDDYYEKYLAAGYEGMIWRADAKYENKRSHHLLKRKEFIDEEYKLIDIEEGNGNRSAMAGRAVCQMSDGRRVDAGIKGSHTFAAQLLRDKNMYIGGEVTIRYFRLTPNGIPRFPVAVAFHPGKRGV